LRERDSKDYGATRLYTMLSEKKMECEWTKSSDKKLLELALSNDSVSGVPQQANMHFSCRSYLIMLLTEVC